MVFAQEWQQKMVVMLSIVEEQKVVKNLALNRLINYCELVHNRKMLLLFENGR